MSTGIDGVIDVLRRQMGPAVVLTGDDVRARPVSMQVHRGCEAGALVRPSSTQEVADVVRLCNEHGVAIVPRAGMTGLVGGTITSSAEIALSLERMSQVQHIDHVSQSMVVEAGTPLQTVQEAARAQGLMFALDLGARGSATIGGNISTNAGGNKVLRYGMTRDMVLGLEVVLPSGEIMSSMFNIMKNNTGLDIKQLFIGAEGTLGIITRAVLRLQPMSGSRHTALCAFTNFESLTTALNKIRRLAGPSLTSFEAMWRDYYELVTQPGRLTPPLARDYPFYALIEFEFSGIESMQEQSQGTQQFETLFGALLEEGLIADAVIAQSESESEALWRIRDEVHYIRTYSPIFTFDISLPTSKMDEYVKTLREELNARWSDPILISYGHLGDGNLHLGISCGEESDKEEVDLMVYRPLVGLRGSVSAEHGIGLSKKPYLAFTRNETELAVMRSVKAALDPKNIMNPGKIL